MASTRRFARSEFLFCNVMPCEQVGGLLGALPQLTTEFLDEEWFERFRPHPGLHRIFNSKLKGVGCTSDALDGELTLYQLDIFRLAAVLETNSSSTANVRTTFSPFSSYCTLMPMKCLWFLEHPSTAIEHIFPFSSSEIFLRIFSANSGIIAGMVFEEMVTLWDKAACIAFIIG
ncbi:Flavohemoprotein [Frankliniella fusca]|uniref:Flavohemoprotein n=1 Tax=Frankliniella fusca TaxID=407009 RepID=A0AAE1HX76_9NEOP|nr:Flavohemoprotein [Frankliniella fusca]KAK3929592.1 Flavohemoprotein [Frankliniella fusca]